MSGDYSTRDDAKAAMLRRDKPSLVVQRGTYRGYKFCVATPEELEHLVAETGRRETFWAIVPTARDVASWRLVHPHMGHARVMADVETYCDQEQDALFRSAVEAFVPFVNLAIEKAVRAPVPDKRVVTAYASRWVIKGGRKRWKGSAHLTWLGVECEEFSRDNLAIVQSAAAMLVEGPKTVPEPPGITLARAYQQTTDGFVDMSIYTDNRAFRVCGAVKAGRNELPDEPPLAAEPLDGHPAPWEATLPFALHPRETGLPAPVMLQGLKPVTRGRSGVRKRKRAFSAHTESEFEEPDMSLDPVRRWHLFLRTDYAKKLGWADLRSDSMLAQPRQEPNSVILRVAHELSDGHTCAAGVRHNGRANNTFFVQLRRLGRSWHVYTKCRFGGNVNAVCRQYGEPGKMTGGWFPLMTAPSSKTPFTLRIAPSSFKP